MHRGATSPGTVVGRAAGRHPALRDPRLMARPFLVALTIAIGAGTVGCEHATGPVAVSYLAIVTLVDAAPGISPGGHYSYRVREVSGTLNIDTTINVAPQDTVIL